MLLDSPELKAAVDKYYPYLVEARRRILFTIVVFVVATTAGFLFCQQIIKFLIEFVGLKGINIVFTSPFQFINLSISCGVASGIVLTFPLIIYQLLSFLKPALRSREYKMVVRFLPLSLILFVAGFLFGTLIMKWQIEIFLNQSLALGIGNVLDVTNLLTTIIITSALMGLSFQFPIVLFVLMRLGIIKSKQLSKWRPWIYLASFIFAVLLPPDSILADVLLTLPLVALFEISLILNHLLGGKK